MRHDVHELFDLESTPDPQLAPLVPDYCEDEPRRERRSLKALPSMAAVLASISRGGTDLPMPIEGETFRLRR
jgi:hypothetical protein